MRARLCAAAGLLTPRGAQHYRVLFFGSDEVALAGLAAVTRLYKQNSLVTQLQLVTANRSENPSVIEKYALSENLKILPWPIEELQHGQFDLGVVVSFGHLIPNRVITKFPLGMVNVHTSLLPRWRGAAPVVHALLHGDTATGVSLMKIKPDHFDVGEIISQESIKVAQDVCLPQLTSELAKLGASMLIKCIETLPHCLHAAKPQVNEGVTYAKKINKSISRVRWAEMTAKDIYNLHRAIYGVYPLTTQFHGKEVKVFGAFLECDDQGTGERATSQPTGSVHYCRKISAIKVLCKDNCFVCFKTLRVVGKREISAFDFYNGYLKKLRREECIFQ